ANLKDLLNELKLSTLAQYFMNSFYFSDRLYITVMRWNTENTFIGRLVHESDIQDPKDENASLIWSTFLVSPIFPSKGIIKKFSGHFDTGNNEDNSIFGIWADAYAHHVVMDSHKTLCITDIEACIVPERRQMIMFDPQANTKQKMSGFWDDGEKGIKHFLDTHICNKICDTLHLRDE
ncbi:hypothetical protein M422DRAFT_119380, partial [Sphaerobolus stellatus SS14]